MQKMKSLFAATTAALAIVSAPVITATQVATVAVPMVVATATMLPTPATAGLVLSEDALGPWARFRNWLNGLVLSE